MKSTDAYGHCYGRIWNICFVLVLLAQSQSNFLLPVSHFLAIVQYTTEEHTENIHKKRVSCRTRKRPNTL